LSGGRFGGLDAVELVIVVGVVDALGGIAGVKSKV
jgi:hypothetical protein